MTLAAPTPKPSIRVACLQVSPGDDLGRNLAEIDRLTRKAVGLGAELVCLPEFATFLDRRSAAMRAAACPQTESEALSQLSGLAAKLGIWLLIGSLVMHTDDGPDGPLANRSFLIRPDGAVAGSYDKIHLFDATLTDGRSVGESRHYRGGDTAVLVHAPFGRVGMSICYDLRFPELYRRLANAGAEILMVPAAFTYATGKAHWEPLLRARAIENGCFVLAPATWGTHPGDWQTHGHASIIDPWGTVLAQCAGSGSDIALADLDLELVARARAQIPSLTTNPTYAIIEQSVVSH